MKIAEIQVTSCSALAPTNCLLLCGGRSRHAGHVSQLRRSARGTRCGADCRTQTRPLAFNPVADQTNGGDDSDHEYSQQHGVFDEGCSVFVFCEPLKNLDGFAHNEISGLKIILGLSEWKGPVAALHRSRFRRPARDPG